MYTLHLILMFALHLMYTLHSLFGIPQLAKAVLARETLRGVSLSFQTS